ncbi:MAG: DUF3991 and TOPRIM domain-containing protein [Mobilitalea sp.]
MEEGRFTEEELAIAKSVDLTAVASSLGYTVRRVGKYYTLKEMDSIRIYEKSHWFRWSRQYERGNNGGSQIDFLRVFCGMDVKTAVFWLLDFAGYSRGSLQEKILQLQHQVNVKPKTQKLEVQKLKAQYPKTADLKAPNPGIPNSKTADLKAPNLEVSNMEALKPEAPNVVEHKLKQGKLIECCPEERSSDFRKPFVLPIASHNNNYLYSYLQEERGIRKEVIDYFVNQRLIYESRHYHNIVFKGNDKNGVTRFASLRGVFDKDGRAFKCDVAGNDKNYGFNVVNDESEDLVVFEAAIDLMSYVDIFHDFDSNKLALGMLADAPVETFLTEHPQISFIKFCLDRDEPGRRAAEELMRKYYYLGYEVEDSPPPEGYKDYNEWLVKSKRLESPMVGQSTTKKRTW